VGLPDVTVLGVDERLRQPLEVCVDPQQSGSIALSRSQKVQVPPVRRRHIKVGHARRKDGLVMTAGRAVTNYFDLKKSM